MLYINGGVNMKKHYKIIFYGLLVSLFTIAVSYGAIAHYRNRKCETVIEDMEKKQIIYRNNFKIQLSNERDYETKISALEKYLRELREELDEYKEMIDRYEKEIEQYKRIINEPMSINPLIAEDLEVGDLWDGAVITSLNLSSSGMTLDVKGYFLVEGELYYSTPLGQPDKYEFVIHRSKYSKNIPFSTPICTEASFEKSCLSFSEYIRIGNQQEFIKMIEEANFDKFENDKKYRMTITVLCDSYRTVQRWGSFGSSQMNVIDVIEEKN